LKRGGPITTERKKTVEAVSEKRGVVVLLGQKKRRRGSIGFQGGRAGFSGLPEEKKRSSREPEKITQRQTWKGKRLDEEKKETPLAYLGKNGRKPLSGLKGGGDFLILTEGKPCCFDERGGRKIHRPKDLGTTERWKKKGRRATGTIVTRGPLVNPKKRKEIKSE